MPLTSPLLTFLRRELKTGLPRILSGLRFGKKLGDGELESLGKVLEFLDLGFNPKNLSLFGFG